MSVNNLNEVMKGMIASMPTKKVDNNFLYEATDDAERPTPLKGGGKDINIWNDDLFHTPNETYFVFQPFNELVTHEDSPALLYLVKCLNIELNTVLVKSIAKVMEAAIKIKTPTKRQREILGDDFKNLNEDTVKYLTKLFKNIKLSHKTRSLVDISLHTKHPVTRALDGNKYAQLKSPLLEALVYWRPSQRLYDTTAPNRTIANQIRAALQLLLPADWDVDKFLVPSKHRLIPRNRALHDLYSDVLDHIGQVLTTLKIDTGYLPEIDSRWTKGLDNMANLLQGIPRNVFGSIGKLREGSEESIEDVSTLAHDILGRGTQKVAPPSSGLGNGGILGGNGNNGILGNQMGLGGGMLNNVPQGYILVPANGLGLGNHGYSNNLHGQAINSPVNSNGGNGGILG